MGLETCPHFFGSLALEKNTADAGCFFQRWFAGWRGGKRFYRVAQCEGGDKGYGEQWFLLHGRLFQFAGCFICGSSYIRKGIRGFVLLVDWLTNCACRKPVSIRMMELITKSQISSEWLRFFMESGISAGCILGSSLPANRFCVPFKCTPMGWTKPLSPGDKVHFYPLQPVRGYFLFSHPWLWPAGLNN